MSVKGQLKKGQSIEDQSPEWRMQRAMEEIDAIVKKYHVRVDVVHQIQVVPLRLVPLQPDQQPAA